MESDGFQPNVQPKSSPIYDQTGAVRWILVDLKPQAGSTNSLQNTSKDAEESRPVTTTTGNIENKYTTGPPKITSTTGHAKTASTTGHLNKEPTTEHAGKACSGISSTKQVSYRITLHLRGHC